MPKIIKISIVPRFLFAMNVLTILFLVGCALTVNGLPSRIVGGNDAPIGKYPFQASLRMYNRHFCGGSIINKRYILTAAHCISGYRNLKYFTVHVGTNFLNETGNSYNVTEILPHKEYDGYALLNDIGLVRLSKDIEYNEKVQPIEIAETDFAGEGHSCTAIGWGTTRLGGSAPNSLQELDLFIESQKKCADLHWRVKDSHICTFIKYGKGLCHGDSGGPLIADGKQVGIVSFGQPCAVGYPDVFTRVSSFHGWVHDNMSGI